MSEFLPVDMSHNRSNVVVVFFGKTSPEWERGVLLMGEPAWALVAVNTLNALFLIRQQKQERMRQKMGRALSLQNLLAEDQWRPDLFHPVRVPLHREGPG